MITRNLILATAGHVDHGKSSIVKALTGTDPDRLPEEKARGITIDLGFAHLELNGTIGSEPATFHLGIVDVPGHEDFVKNMVAGVGSIDLALLVVAADDGWMPQTEEHLQILAYLGVTRAVVALTKIDLSENEDAALTEIRAALNESPFANAPIIPTSTATDRGIGELKNALLALLEDSPPPPDIGKPRLPVDRVFTLRGIGTVVTGTLSGGTFHRGQSIVIQPTGGTARIRSLQSHNREIESSGPGMRTAINVVDAKIPSGDKTIQRGDVIALPEFGAAVKIADVLLEKSPRLKNLKSPAARALKDRSRVRIHLGSGNVPAHVTLLEGNMLEPGGRSLAQLRFENPVFLFAGDRFIVRDWSEQATLAGGVILDPDPDRGISRERCIQLLKTCADAPNDVNAFVLAAIQRARAIRASTLLVQSRFSPGEVTAGIEKLAAKKHLVLALPWAIDASWWAQLRDHAANLIDQSHKEHPERPGLPIRELESAISKELPAGDLFDLLLRELAGNGLTQSGQSIRRSTHRLALPAHLTSAGAKLRQALSAKPFDPPSRKELAPDPATQQALRFFLETGEAVYLGEEVVLLADSFHRATEQVKTFLRSRSSATASELRQALGTSRRVLIPLLEKLDKDGVTVRQGDKRVLRA